jgi:cytochrome c
MFKSEQGKRMKKTYLLPLIFFSIVQVHCATSTTAVSKGKILFNNPDLGNGTTGKTCTTCHENGEGISKDFDTKKTYTVMGLEIQSLPEVINSCIEITLRGEGIDLEGEEMKNFIHYIKNLKHNEKSPRSK